MKIGLIGYQGSGKSSLFHWLTMVAPDLSMAHTGQTASSPVPDPRIEALCEIYHPKKVTQAGIEIVDTPGLSRTHEGNAARLAVIREAGACVLVVPAYEGCDPARDLASFEEDLLLADLEIVTGRVERLRESVKKPRPNRDQELIELAALEPLVAQLEEGQALELDQLTEDQRRATRSFRLLTEKPRLIVFNLADDETNPDKVLALCPAGETALAAPLRLAVELEEMEPEDRQQFLEEMGVAVPERGQFLRDVMHGSGQFLYFTAGEKEVRSWMLPKGGTAVDAAANIHTDLARGFIRAEITRCEDMLRLGSEREIKAHSLLRQEPKDYVMQDGDILLVRSGI